MNIIIKHTNKPDISLSLQCWTSCALAAGKRDLCTTGSASSIIKTDQPDSWACVQGHYLYWGNWPWVVVMRYAFKHRRCMYMLPAPLCSRVAEHADWTSRHRAENTRWLKHQSKVRDQGMQTKWIGKRLGTFCTLQAIELIRPSEGQTTYPTKSSGHHPQVYPIRLLTCRHTDLPDD